jgi:phosphatidylinositol glycan class B
MTFNQLSYNKAYALLAVAALVYVTAAWNNVGYYHADEHYQLIEFSGLKLGWNSEENLAWEYHSMIRPTFLVWVCYIILDLFKSLGVADPYKATEHGGSTSSYVATKVNCPTDGNRYYCETYFPC